MKLTYSAASPFARKVRIAAIELGLIDKIEFVLTSVVPAQANDEYMKITPLKKLPVLILDDGSVISGAWALGDNAQVPDLTAAKQPAYYTPNAQNAIRQAGVAARNIVNDIRGEDLEEYRHASLGTIASYGVGDGAALILGVKLKKLPAWLVHRAYHGLLVPTVNRKFRVIAGWIIDALALPEVTSLSALRHPRRAFTTAFTTEKSK